MNLNDTLDCKKSKIKAITIRVDVEKWKALKMALIRASAGRIKIRSIKSLFGEFIDNYVKEWEEK